MNKKRFLTLLICAIIGSWNMLHAQDKLIVHSTNNVGTDWETVLSDLKKITFSNTEIAFVGQQDQTYYTLAYQDIDRIVFSLTGTGVVASKAVSNMFVYPNPVTDYLEISGWDVDKKADMAIYSVTGQLFDIQKEWCGTPVSVSSLPEGFYIFKVNGQSFKFRKL